MSGYYETMHVSKDVAEALDENVERALISSREGAANTTLSYLRGDVIANYLNETFGPLGWEVSSKIDRVDTHEATRKGYQGKPDKDVFVVQVITAVTLTIKPTKEGATSTSYTQTGLGYGEVEIDKQRKDAYNMAIKGADTDGLKRCSTFLGRRLGMFLIDGVQSDIDYAHNGGRNKAAARKNARSMREADRREDEDRRQRRLTDQRARATEDDGAAAGSSRAAKASDALNGTSGNAKDGGGNGGAASGGGAAGGRGADDADRKTTDAAAADRDRTGGGATDGGKGEAVKGGQDKGGDGADRDKGSRSDGDAVKGKEAGAKVGGGKTNGGGGTGGKDDDARTAGDQGGSGDRAKQSDGKSDDVRDTGKKAPAAAYDDNYNLQEIPVTRQQMIDFGATIVKQVKGLNQVKDRNKLVEQHAHTIRNVLDHKIGTATINRLREADVDVDKLLG